MKLLWRERKQVHMWVALIFFGENAEIHVLIIISTY